MSTTATTTHAAGAGTKPRPFRTIMSTLGRLVKEAGALPRAPVNGLPARLETFAGQMAAAHAELEVWFAANAANGGKGGGGKAGG